LREEQPSIDRREGGLQAEPGFRLLEVMNQEIDPSAMDRVRGYALRAYIGVFDPKRDQALA